MGQKLEQGLVWRRTAYRSAAAAAFAEFLKTDLRTEVRTGVSCHALDEGSSRDEQVALSVFNDSRRQVL